MRFYILRILAILLPFLLQVYGGTDLQNYSLENTANIGYFSPKITEFIKNNPAEFQWKADQLFLHI